MEKMTLEENGNKPSGRWVIHTKNNEVHPDHEKIDL